MKNKLLIPWAKPDIGIEEFKQVQSSFKSNWLTQGPKVKEFEKRMANFCNSKYGIAVSNGTSALDIAYKTLKIEEGDEVILPALSYFSTASMITYQKAIPVFVDIKQNNFNLDPEQIQKAITKKTKAIAFIDYGGNPSQLNEILNIGKKNNIKVLQDGAQSLGALYNGKPMGANTLISTMSFHMAKILSTVEGGMIFTNNEKLKNEIIMRRSHGEKKPGDYKHNILGYNARMTDLQAGIGLAQINKLKFFLKKRQKVAKSYDNFFKNCKNITLPETNKNCKNAYFFYPILLKNRDVIARKLKKIYGIDTRVAYRYPLYKQNLYKNKKAKFIKKSCPIAEKISSKILNLPIYPSLKYKEIKYIFDSIYKEIK